MNELDLVLGIYDNPEHQTQSDYSVDLSKHNVAIFGSSRSGKTTIVKTLLIRLHQKERFSEKEEVYILDFSNDLSDYRKLPYVMAYFDAMHEENVRRIFRKIEDRLSENIKAMPGISYDQCVPDIRPAHVTFILDGLNALMAENRYSAYHDSLQRITRDGLSKGITVVFTAYEPSGGITRFLSSFKRIIALDLQKDKYLDLFGRRVEKPIPVEGRGMVNLEMGVYEFQAYFPYDADDRSLNDEIAVAALEDQMRVHYSESGKKDDFQKFLFRCEQKKMITFAGDLTKVNWETYTRVRWPGYHPGGNLRETARCEDTEFVAGLDYYTLEPVRINLMKTRSIAIYGKKNFGKTNLLGLILETALKIPDVRFVIWEDGRKKVEDADDICRITASLRAEGKTRIYFKYNKEEFETFLNKEYPEWEDKKENLAAIMPDLSMPNFRFGNETMNILSTNTTDTLGISETVGMESSKGQISDSTLGDETLTQCEKPFTVFVIQSRLYYQVLSSVPSCYQLMVRMAPFISNEDMKNRKLFIFSDVQRITDSEMMVCFNNYVDHAFLLDDILRFVNDRGKGSVFGTQDPDELKESFGKCELGDGFYLNLERDELVKVKFLKQS